jgi:hypothetical protein
MIAANHQGILDELRSIVRQEPRADLLDNISVSTNPAIKKMNMKNQVPLSVLAAIDQKFIEKFGLHLCAYELAEINRFITGGAKLDSLLRYWEKLDPDVTAAALADSALAEAAGSMSFDGEFRKAFAGGKRLQDFGFKGVDPDVETKFRLAVQPGTEADVAASQFFDDTWSSPTCGGLFRASPSWLHVNM